MTSRGKVDTLSAALLFAGALVTVATIALCFGVILRRQFRLRNDDASSSEAEQGKGGNLGVTAIGVTAADQLAATEAWMAATQEKSQAMQPPLHFSPTIGRLPRRSSLVSSDSESYLSSTDSCMSDGGATVTPPPSFVCIYSIPTALPALPPVG